MATNWKKAFKMMGGAAAGGLTAAMASGLAVRTGIAKPETAAAAVTAVGVVGVATGKGTLQHASIGVIGVGAGQLTYGWMAKRSIGATAPQEVRRLEQGGQHVQQRQVADAFDQARLQMSEQQQADENQGDDEVYQEVIVEAEAEAA